MVTGDLLSFTVRNATIFDADGSGFGINGNGWVGELLIEGLPTITPSAVDASKITIATSDPGYNSDGSTTTRTRSIKAGKVLRRQRPNESSFLVEQITGNTRITVSLEDDIYSGTTLTSVTVASGLYSGSTAGTVPSRVNNSTLAYPKPLFAWLNIQHERATGSSFAVEAVAYHRHAMLGRQVARVEFIGSDGTNTAATQAATTPALSSFQVKGQIVEAYKANVPLTALTQGALCSVNAKVYPWIGDAASVLDLSADGIAWPTARPRTLLRFLNDKTGGYGGAVACVKAGASGGTVQSSIGAARATPFPTINAAIAALPAWNNANKGHNDHSGSTVYLMDDGAGGAVAHAPAAGFTSTAVGQCWTDVRADPANTAAVSVSLSVTRGACSLIRWLVDITHTAGNGFDSGINSGSVLAAYENLTVAASGTVGVNYRQHFSYWRNVTVTGSANPPSFVAPSGAIRMHGALILGHVQEAVAQDRTWNAYAVIGCKTKRVVLTEQDVATFTAIEQMTNGGVIANNVMRDQRASQHIARLAASPDGVAIVQNVFEHANVSGIALQVGADGAVQPFDNILLHHNTIVGDRLNIAYNDVAGSEGVVKRLTSRFNLMAEVNTKSDMFTTANGGATNSTGRVGPWRFLHRTGCRGDVSLIGSAAGTAPGLGSWLGEYWPDGEYNVSRAAVGFVDDKGNWQPTATIGAGSGDYHLTGTTNAAYDNVPSGLAMLAFDLDGAARRNDGLGAAGAYERTAGIDTTAPVITSSDNVSVVENATLALALEADEAVTWTIRTAAQNAASVDNAQFELSGAILRWTSNGTRDFEAPADTGANNSYVVVVRATDTVGNFSDQTITVNVTNIDDTAPVITSSASISVAENAQLSHTLTANESVSFAIRTVAQNPSSVDHTQFEISGTTLRWSSNGTRDYEAPADADTNNSYVVVVRATDGAGNFSEQAITVTVTNVAEGGGGGSFTAQFSSKTYQQIVISVAGFTAGFSRVDVQYSTRPDFQFALSPLVTNILPSGGNVTIDRLNQRTRYFIRVRERNGTTVGAWAPVIAVYTPSNTALVLTPAAVLVSPALIMIPEPVIAWTADAIVAGYPASNLGFDAPGDQWWSDYISPGYAFEMLTAGAPVDTIALLETNAPDAATITVKGGNSYANVRGGSPSYSSGALAFHASPNLGDRPGYHALVRLPSPQNYTHWRVEIGGQAPLGRFVASHACIGLARATRNRANDPSETLVDLTSLDRTREGVPDRRAGYRRGRRLDFEIVMMTEAQYEGVYADMRHAIGLATPALVVPNTKSGQFLHDRILYGPISQQKMSVPHATRFSLSFTIDSLI